MKTIIILCILGMLFTTGCNELLTPDRFGIGFSQARYREEDAAYRGYNINLQWDLK